MAAAAGGVAFDRAEWEQQLQVGDLLDAHFDADDDSPEGWYVCRVIEATEAEVKVRLLYWNQNAAEFNERSDADLQPLATKTLGKYTGPPGRLAAFVHAPTLPALAAIPLHKHQLQRFRFDFNWHCAKCAGRFESNEMPAYSCLPCKYDLCVDCFIEAGGVDTHPLPCEAPPAKRVKLENYSKVDFADRLEELECDVCTSIVHNPPNLLCGHLFCSGCLAKIDPKLCPTCCQPFDLSRLHPIPFVQRQISQKKGYCLNHECDWIGELGVDERNLTDHLLVCPHNLFACPRCAEQVKVVDAQQHGDEECKVQSSPATAAKKKKKPAKRKR